MPNGNNIFEDEQQSNDPNNEQGTSFQDTNLFIDPNTAALFKTGLETGDVSGLAASFFRPPEERRAEEERRISTLTTGVQAAGKAAILEGTEPIRRTFQRQGKALSSSVVFGEGGLLDLSEEVKLKSEAQLQQGILDIYGQVGQEFGQQEALGVDIFGVGIGAKTQRDITNIRATTDKAIAQIEASTTLTGFQKQIEIANANNSAAERIAAVHEAGETLRTEKRITSAENMQTAGFDFFTNDGIKNWVSSLEFQNLTLEEQVRQFDASLIESARTFDVTNREQIRQFNESLNIMYKELDIKEDRNEWEKDIADRTLSESLRQFDLTLEDSIIKFDQQLDWAKNSFDLEDSRIRELQRDAILEQARQFDITDETSLYKFGELQRQSIHQFDLTFNQSKDIQNAALKIQQEKHATDQIGATIGIQLQVLENPAVVSFLDKLEDNEAMLFTNNILTNIFIQVLETGNPDMQPGEIQALINRVIGETIDPSTVEKFTFPPTSASIEKVVFDNWSKEKQDAWKAQYSPDGWERMLRE